MTPTRREFLRRGALWVAGAALVEPVAKKLWAFPTNPLGTRSRIVAHDTIGGTGSWMWTNCHVTIRVEPIGGTWRTTGFSYDGGVTWEPVTVPGRTITSSSILPVGR